MLVLPSIPRRYENSNEFHVAIVNKFRRVLGIQDVPRRPQLQVIPAKCDRCFKCVEAIVGCDDYKKARKKLNNKLKSKCGKCKYFGCKIHVKSVENVCKDCFVEE